MKARWMLFDKKKRLALWIAFPTKQRADYYRLIGEQCWLKPPYYVKGKITKHGSMFAKQQVKDALKMRDDVKAMKVKIIIQEENEE